MTSWLPPGPVVHGHNRAMYAGCAPDAFAFANGRGPRGAPPMLAEDSYDSQLGFPSTPSPSMAASGMMINRLATQPLPVPPSCAAPMDLSSMPGRVQLPPPPALPAWLCPEVDVHPAPLYSPRVGGRAALPADAEELSTGSTGATDIVKVKNTFIEVNG